MLVSALFICTSYLFHRAISLVLDSPQALNVHTNSSSNRASSGRLPGFLQPLPLNKTQSSPLSLTTQASGPTATGLDSPGVKYVCDAAAFGEPKMSSCLDAMKRMGDEGNLETFVDRQTAQAGDIPLPLRYSSGL